jgi:hypothetical protein
MFPETRSQLFDLREWAEHLANTLSRMGQDGSFEMVTWMHALVAVEEALLFFDPGEERPRADAFFHTPDVTEDMRMRLVRTPLEGVREQLRNAEASK